MAYGHYRNGFLPSVGGWGDQPYTFTEAMRLIDQCVATNEKRRLDG